MMSGGGNMDIPLLSKSVEQAEIVSSAITDLIDSSAMEHSVYPELGGNIDISIQQKLRERKLS